MEDYTAVFDISSDEEPALDVAARGDDYSWLTKILYDDVDDADDVVLVGEIKSKTSKVTASNKEDDDDCVILDGDPDKPVAVDDDKADDVDDLVIVSQKGQGLVLHVTGLRFLLQQHTMHGSAACASLDGKLKV